MNTVALIEQKITEGKEILEGLSSMRERPGMAINVTYYVAEDVQGAIRKINKWQLTCKEILISRFGESHRHIASFVGTITAKNIGFNYRREFEREMNDGLSVLEGISEALKLCLDVDNVSDQIETNDKTKSPMVFISHSSKDINFVEGLVDLLEFLGLNNDTMFCSSVPGYDIKLSGRIIDNLLSIFELHKLYVIFVQSPNYYRSPISLNEMGAAWILKSKFCSLLTKDMSFDKMLGVIDSSYISIKVDENNATARLNQMKDEIVDMFEINQPNNNRWERKRNDFLRSVGNHFVTNEIDKVNKSMSELNNITNNQPSIHVEGNTLVFDNGINIK